MLLPGNIDSKRKRCRYAIKQKSIASIFTRLASAIISLFCKAYIPSHYRENKRLL